MDTRKTPAGDAGEKNKAAFSRGLLELYGHHRCPVELLRRFGRLRRRRLRSPRTRSRPRSSWLCGPCGRWRRYARLHVVGVDDRFGDIGRLTPPEHIALRPGLGRIYNHAKAVLLRILHDHGSHLLQHAARDLLLLVAEFFLGILHGTIEKLLLALDLLLQCG